MLLKVMFSFFQPRGKIGSYHNNIDAGLLFRLADSKVSIHTAFMTGSFLTMQKM